MEILSYLGSMSNILNNLTKLKKSLTDNVTLVAISKTYTTDNVKELYSYGVTNFGENRSSELLRKKSLLSDLTINWHFVGSLQSNKVKEVINEIDYLHSLDRLSLVKTINKYRSKPLKCFIQVNVLKEETKSGLFLEDLDNFINSLKNYDKIDVIGFMAMGVLNDLEKTAVVFKTLKDLSLKYNLKELSMGMTDDYKLALNYQTTFIRIGRLLVGDDHNEKK